MAARRVRTAKAAFLEPAAAGIAPVLELKINCSIEDRDE